MRDARQHVRMLVQQDRFVDAIPPLGTAIASDPDDAELRGLMAYCLVGVKRYKDAVKEATRAITLEPEEDGFHRILAAAYAGASDLRKAEKSAREAVRLNPDSAPNFAVLAGTLARQGRWREALDNANLGLGVDPTHPECQRQRAQALSFMGATDAARETVSEALRDDPNSADAHTETAWISLRQGDHNRAIAEFKEALRIDPQNTWAQTGLLEALRARFVPYGFMMRINFLIGRLPAKYQTVVFVAIYILFRATAAASSAETPYRVFLIPIAVALGIFVALRYIGRPLANIMLLFHPLGHLALGRTRRREAGVMFGFLVTALVGAALWLLMPHAEAGAGGGALAFTAVFSFFLLCLASRVTSTPRSHAVVFWSVAGCCFLMNLLVFVAIAASPGPKSDADSPETAPIHRPS